MAPTKHGESIEGKRSKLYGRWLTMRNKCTNPKHQAYKWYGAKGIKVCDRWNDFAAFKKDVGDIPGPGWTLDRIDGNGNYEPGNVRWATAETQSNNKPHNVGKAGIRPVTLPDGRVISIKMAEREFGFKMNTIKNRLNRGWPQEHLFDPPGAFQFKERKSVGNSKFIDTPWGKLTISKAAEKAGVKVAAMSVRVRSWSTERWFDKRYSRE